MVGVEGEGWATVAGVADVDTVWNVFKILVRNHSLLSMCYYPGERGREGGVGRGW